MFLKHIVCLSLLLGTSAALADGSEPAAPAVSPAANATPADAAKDSANKPATSAAAAGEKATAAPTSAAPAQPPGGDVKMSGMSILGNEDAPKSLVLVPWKSSQLGDMPSVSRLLDSAAQPVDKEVFMRELSYYEFRTGGK